MLINIEGENRYQDEQAYQVARHLPGLETLIADNNEFGEEGVTATAMNLTKLGTLRISHNRDAAQSIGSLGRLPNLKTLLARTQLLLQLQVASAPRTGASLGWPRCRGASNVCGSVSCWCNSGVEDSSAECRLAVQRSLPEKASIV